MEIKHFEDNKSATTHGASGKQLLKFGNDVK
jgi:hypothetical protein